MSTLYMNIVNSNLLHQYLDTSTNPPSPNSREPLGNETLNDEAKTAIIKIWELLKSCSKSNFLSTLTAIADFLSHQDETVKTTAAFAIAFIFEHIVLEVLSDPSISPEEMKRLAEAINDLYVEKIRPHIGAFSSELKKIIARVMCLIKSILQGTADVKKPDRCERFDIFIKSELQKSVSNLFPNFTQDKFTNSNA